MLEPGRVLCRLEDVPDPGARGFVFGEDSARTELFLVRRGKLLRAYLNECPHNRLPLDTFPDRFLTADGQAILCSGHGARFRLEDGSCFEGPCLGRRLKALPLWVADGVVRLGGAERSAIG